jgi:hypothetical protein
MASQPSRVRPLAVQVGDVHLFLSSGDVELLLDGIDRLMAGMVKSHATSAGRPGVAEALQAHIADLEGLRQVFSRPSVSLADPPLKLDRGEARLVRSVLADIDGYQRGDLTPGLRELRQLVANR